ncbi:unnamed protein product [Symbiodinium sp. CCMP2592]|nr:unnamed protein product [Symbiodinium sp. CCMP2592]
MGVGPSCAPSSACCKPGEEPGVVEQVEAEAKLGQLEQLPVIKDGDVAAVDTETGGLDRSCTYSTLMEIPDLPTRGSSGATIGMSKTERHTLGRYSHIDMGVARGMSLRKSLEGFGRLWRYNPATWADEDRMSLYNMSTKVTHFQTFVSHTWRSPGRWKVLSLSLQCGWHYGLASWLFAATLCTTLCLADVLPMPLTYRANIMGFVDVCPMGLWIMTCSCLAMGLGLMSTPLWPDRCGRSTDTCFIDVASIHQVDKTLMERGVFGIAGFLSISSEMRILWSSPYFSRLWCVFELAAYKKVNPDGRITFRPLFIEQAVLAMMLCSYLFSFLCLFTRDVFYDNVIVLLLIFAVAWPVAIYVLRMNFRQKHQLLYQLDNFDLDTVKCSQQFDRDFILAAIEKWYGSKQAFVDFVRQDLKYELEKSLSRTRLPNQYLLLLLTPVLSLSAEFFLAAWKGGAPSDALLSFAVGILLGFDVFFIWASNLLMIYLCDVLAPRRSGHLDHLQTLFIMVLIVTTLYVGSVVSARAYQHSLAGALIFLGVSVLLAACMSWLEGRSVASLLRYCRRACSHAEVEFGPEQ